MDERLENIPSQIVKQRNFDEPPLHLWHPELSGDIDIRITRDGVWYHQGGRIEREALVRLFASILRRENDGEYYLVTPAEKWRIRVDLHPLIVTDVEAAGVPAASRLLAILNTGKRLLIGPDHPLFLEPAIGDIAGVRLDHGLSALCSRPAWYRLVAMCELRDGRPIAVSGDYTFPLAAGAAT